MRLGHLILSAATVVAISCAVAAPASAAPVPCDGQWHTQPGQKPWVSQEPIYLQSVDASSATDAWAVGFERGEFYKDRTYTMHWNGSAWKRVASPPKKGSAALYGVSVVGPGDAWAVGSTRRGTEKALVLHWNGTAWSRVALPALRALPGISYGMSVEAFAANDVWVGGGGRSEGSVYTFMLHWDGSTWSGTATLGSAMREMDVLSSTDAFMVGHYGGVTPVVSRWNGAAWSAYWIPYPDFIGPQDVVAIAGNDAWQVGQGAGGVPTSLHWDGTNWNWVSVPQIGGSTALYTVEYDPIFGLVAAGRYSQPTSGVAIMRWNGTDWDIMNQQSFSRAPAISDLALIGKQGFAIGGRNGRMLLMASCLP